MASRQRELRLFFLLIFLILPLFTVAVRLIFIQGVEAEKYRSLALRQHLRVLELPFYRGAIYDREGEELAVSIEADTVYATPYLIKNPLKVASKLSPILNLSQAELLKKLTKDKGFVYLARKIPRKKGKKIKALNIEGIGVLKESKRYYPQGNLASHILGFAGMDNKGLSGLELYYDSVLKGKPGRLITEIDPLGRSIPGGIFKLSSPRQGKNIVLTLDKDIQYKVQQELKKAVKEFKAKGGTAIVTNPSTGEIYALATVPGFDLNNFSQTDSEVLRNRAVTDVYEPGSTMKVVTAAAALEEKIAHSETAFYLPGKIRVGGKTIGDSHPRSAQGFTFTQIITKSSNVGAVTLGLKLGKERLYEYIKTFGLTKKTGIDFPGEVSGYTPPPQKWWGSSIGNIPFGQGISATPLQMIQVISVIANGGFLVRPHLLSKITDAKGRLIKVFSQDSGGKVISSRVASQMQEILEKAVEEGTGKEAKIAQYRVAGKTGTAQKPDAHGYASGKYIASFMGFAPAQDAQVSVLVVIEEPQGAIFGAVVAAPAFKNIIQFSLQHLRIPPTSRSLTSINN